MIKANFLTQTVETVFCWAISRRDVTVKMMVNISFLLGKVSFGVKVVLVKLWRHTKSYRLTFPIKRKFLLSPFIQFKITFEQNLPIKRGRKLQTFLLSLREVLTPVYFCRMTLVIYNLGLIFRQQICYFRINFKC